MAHDPGASIWQCRDCDRCERARRRHRKQYLTRVERTGLARVPSGPVADVADAWVREGFGAPVLAAAAGVTRGPLYSLVNRRQECVERSLADTLMGLDRAALYRAVRGREYVPAVGARRRLQALAWAGWDTVGMGVMSAPVWRRIAHAPVRLGVPAYQRQVFAEKYWATRDAFESLALLRGPSEWHRSLALEQGWAPPLAWDDDIDMDDPLVEPFAADSAGDATALAEDVRWLLAAHPRRTHGEMEAICQRLGLPATTVDQRLRRVGETMLAKPFNRHSQWLRAQKLQAGAA